MDINDQSGKVRQPDASVENSKPMQPAPRKKAPRPNTEGQPPRRTAPESGPVRRKKAPETAQASAADGPRKKAPTKRPEGAAATKKPVRKTGDSGYMPYEKANRKKKNSQSRMLRNFLSGKKNPDGKPIRFGTTAAPQTEEERRRSKKKQAPAVVYTDGKAFSRTRLVVQLVSVISVVLAFVLGLSIFFRVKTIEVIGNEVYSAWAIREASGISEGDNLLTFGRSRAAGLIIANLPYVKNTRIGIKLPDTVKIEIEEEDVVYSIESAEGSWWLMTSEGKVVEQTNASKANDYTKVLGVKLSAPKAGEMATPEEQMVEQADEESGGGLSSMLSSLVGGGEEQAAQPIITGRVRLDVVLEILKALEKNDVVGEAASIDVSRMEDIILWYGTQYQVNLGDHKNMDKKISDMVDVILQMSDYQNGILDISYTTWTDQVGFTPFS